MWYRLSLYKHNIETQTQQIVITKHGHRQSLEYQHLLINRIKFLTYNAEHFIATGGICFTNQIFIYSKFYLMCDPRLM